MTPADASRLDRIAELIGAGHPDMAANEAATVRARFPSDPEAARLHGIALFQLGRHDEALAALDAARALAPDAVDVLCNIGSVNLAAGHLAPAVQAFEQAQRLAPAHPAVLNGLGNARRASGDDIGAQAAYLAATAAAPGHVGAWCNLAAVQAALGQATQSEATARQALMLAPGHPEACLLLGHALAAQRRHAQAEAAYAAGERSVPRDARFPYQRGLMAEEQRQFALAAAAHARALALDPSLDAALGQLVFLRRQLCDWSDLDRLSSELRARVAHGRPGLSPFAFLAEPAGAAEQLRCATTHARTIEARIGARRMPAVAAPRDDSAPLRLGFVANGFGNHPTALLVVAFLEALRRLDVQAQLYSTAPDDGSAMHARVRTAAHAWTDASSMNAIQLAGAIAAQQVDVLLDLDGYCAGAMPEALALRPAPIQVNWLAYPGTLGAPWIDYVIADRIVLPAAMREHFSERVAWLPRCFQPSDPTRAVAVPPPRSTCGLPETGVVFACLNNSYKINPASFERLLAVLRGVPGAVLWLLSAADGAEQRLRNEAERRGVPGTRLVFAPKLPQDEYLARYRHADLFLDCAPYGAHTTASDAIWAGCPVLTLPGDTFASRVGASLNHHLGMPDLNARDDGDFVAIATRLGHDAGARAALRERVAQARDGSGLFDMDGYARDFLALVRRMVERHRLGLPAAALE